MQFISITHVTISYANPSCLLADGRASGSSMNNLKLNRKLKLNSKPTLKPTSNYESSGDLGRRLFDKNPPASLEDGGRSSGLSNDESIGDFGQWLFANPAASLEVAGRALGLSNYKASETAAKIGKMRITRPRDALERSRYAQTTCVCVKLR